MVSISSPRKTTEAVQNDAGQLANDGLNYDDANNSLDVSTGTMIEIDGNQDVGFTAAAVLWGGY